MSATKTDIKQNTEMNCVLKNAHHILGFSAKGRPKLVYTWKCSCGMNSSTLPKDFTPSHGDSIDFYSSDEEDFVEECKCCMAKKYRENGLNDPHNLTCKNCFEYVGDLPGTRNFNSTNVKLPNVLR